MLKDSICFKEFEKVARYKYHTKLILGKDYLLSDDGVVIYRWITLVQAAGVFEEGFNTALKCYGINNYKNK